MRPQIIDEFTNLPISRQRKYQLRQLRDGRCMICGEAAVSASSRCLKHLIWSRERQRKYIGARRRYRTLSYKLAEKSPQPSSQADAVTSRKG